jgi:hypothetical protein
MVAMVLNWGLKAFFGVQFFDKNPRIANVLKMVIALGGFSFLVMGLVMLKDSFSGHGHDGQPLQLLTIPFSFFCFVVAYGGLRWGWAFKKKSIVEPLSLIASGIKIGIGIVSALFFIVPAGLLIFGLIRHLFGLAIR